jgi:protein-L-isoaspartate(D-aspartate) O-methyltransferase
MDFLAARKHMVENQLMPNKINQQNIKERFLNVPREFFVQPADVAMSYSDDFVSMGLGRDMLPPMIQARLLQELNIQSDNKVLILAAGTGYSAVLAAPLCFHVWSVEEETSLRDVARKAATNAKCSNITVKAGKSEEGLKSDAPFDRILIDAPIGFLPEIITKQLADNGKLVAVIENEYGILQAKRYTKSGKTMLEESMFDTKGSVLKNFTKDDKFVF